MAASRQFVVHVSFDTLSFSDGAPVALCESVYGALEAACALQLQTRLTERSFKCKGFPFSASTTTGAALGAIYAQLEACQATVLSTCEQDERFTYLCDIPGIERAVPPAPFAVNFSGDTITLWTEPLAPASQAALEEALTMRLPQLGYRIQKNWVGGKWRTRAVKLKGYPVAENAPYFVSGVLSLMLELGCEICALPCAGYVLLRPGPDERMQAPISSKEVPAPACFCVKMMANELIVSGVQIKPFLALLQDLAARFAAGALEVVRAACIKAPGASSGGDTLSVRLRGDPFDDHPTRGSLPLICALVEMLGEISGRVFVGRITGASLMLLAVYGAPARPRPTGRGTARLLVLHDDVLLASSTVAPSLLVELRAACVEHVAPLHRDWQASVQKLGAARTKLAPLAKLTLKGSAPLRDNHAASVQALLCVLASRAGVELWPSSASMCDSASDPSAYDCAIGFYDTAGEPGAREGDDSLPLYAD